MIRIVISQTHKKTQEEEGCRVGLTHIQVTEITQGNSKMRVGLLEITIELQCGPVVYRGFIKTPIAMKPTA
jgi:hypothetical protein